MNQKPTNKNELISKLDSKIKQEEWNRRYLGRQIYDMEYRENRSLSEFNQIKLGKSEK